ncbi:MAG: TrmH family RNA methyltransferase [Selenomonas sp.]
MIQIESLTNPKIKLAAQLAKRMAREKTGKFLAEGVRLAEMAAASDWDVGYALVTPHAAGEPRAAAVIATLEENGVPVALVPESVYQKAGDTQTPQGLLLVLAQKQRSLDDLARLTKTSVSPTGTATAGASAAAQPPCYVVLDRIQDPGNLGTILRTADAAGMAGLILLKGTTDIYSPKVVRAAMGSLFHLPVVSGVTEEAFLSFARESGLRLYATALDAKARPYDAADFTGPAAIIFGNEGQGVSETLLASSETLYIPMYGGAESLNVAVSTAIVLYEAVRQRHTGSLSEGAVSGAD